MKGEIRNPMTVWLISLFTCHLYGLYTLFTIHNELKNYLGKEDYNPIVELLITWICAPYGIIRLGKYVQEAQQKAGIPNAEDQGIMFFVMMLLCGFGYSKIQTEVNRIWEGGGGAPATF